MDKDMRDLVMNNEQAQKLWEKVAVTLPNGYYCSNVNRRTSLIDDKPYRSYFFAIWKQDATHPLVTILNEQDWNDFQDFMVAWTEKKREDEIVTFMKETPDFFFTPEEEEVEQKRNKQQYQEMKSRICVHKQYIAACPICSPESHPTY